MDPISQQLVLKLEASTFKAELLPFRNQTIRLQHELEVKRNMLSSMISNFGNNYFRITVTQLQLVKLGTELCLFEIYYRPRKEGKSFYLPFASLRLEPLPLHHSFHSDQSI